MKKYFIILFGLFLLGGCSSKNNDINGLIGYMDAKEMIINDGALLIDVRTDDEYNENHIDGALLLTLDTINEDSASDIIDNKNTPIIVYCQSGNRSAQAVIKLNDLGYTMVYDLGSINNWKE